MPYHLFICRHAQAQNPGFNQSDFDRQLTLTGIQEAEQAGNWLQQLPIKPASVICSSAQRTRSTAKIITEKLGFDPEAIITDKTLYNAPESNLLACLVKLPPDVTSVLLVGHNPGVSDLIRSLSGSYNGDVATGSVHYLQFEMESWPDLYATSAISYLAFSSSH